MERFNLSFRREGRFYMEGVCQVQLPIDGPATLAEVIAAAQTGEFTKFYPTKLDFFDDETQFNRMNKAPDPLHVVEEPSVA